MTTAYTLNDVRVEVPAEKPVVVIPADEQISELHDLPDEAPIEFSQETREEFIEAAIPPELEGS
jgi:hypothetical protein